MRSKTSFCNAALYRKNITRFAPLWIAYFALLLIALPLSILSQGREAYDAADLVRYLLDLALDAGCLLNLLYACALAMCFQGWMFRSRSVNALAALPIRRETMFGTHLLSALTVSLLPNLLTALLTWGAAAALGLPGFLAAAQWLGVMTLEFLFFYGLAALCAALVGQLLALPGLYVLLNFGAVVLNYAAMAVLSTFVYGLPDGGYTVLAPFSPAFYILYRMDAYSKYIPTIPETAASSAVQVSAPMEHVYLDWTNWRYLLIVAAVGLVLLAAAFLLHRRRSMERSGSLMVFKPLRPVLKYCFTTGCALVLGVLAASFFFNGSTDRLWVLVLCMLAGGFVGYFVAEILFQKSFHVFGREWLGFGVFCACLLLCVGLMRFDAFGYERRVPAAETVESVGIHAYNIDGTVTDAAHIADLITLHQGLVDEKESQRTLARQMRSGGREPIDYTWVDFTYQLKDGSSLVRSYQLYCSEQMWLDSASLPRRYAQLAQDPYYIQLGRTPDFQVQPEDMGYCELGYYDPAVDSWRYETLSSQDAYALYAECVVPDLQVGAMGYRAPFIFEDLSDIEYAADLTISFERTAEAGTGREPERVVLDSFYLQIDPTLGSRTAARLEELGYSLCLEGQREMIAATVAVDRPAY